jgi:hypothetical protein
MVNMSTQTLENQVLESKEPDRRQFFKSAGRVATFGLSLTAIGKALAGCASIMPRTTTIDDLIVVSYPPSVPQDQIEAFLSETRTAYHKLVDFLGVMKKKVHISVDDYQSPHIMPSESYQIKYPISFLPGKIHPGMWHELVHSLTESAIDFYPEGLANYVGFKFGIRRDGIRDAHVYLTQILKEYGQKISVLEVFNVKVGSVNLSRVQSQLTTNLHYS